MKKEYHYTISRTDRICLVSFVVLLLAWELVKGLIPHDEKPYEYISMESENVKEYVPQNKYEKKKYTRKQYPKKSNWKNRYDEKPKQPYKKAYPAAIPPSQPLPLKTASINELISMGFSVKVAFNIQKYFSSGGGISNATDLLKIYGMDSIQLQKVSPHIIFDDPPSDIVNVSFKKEYVSKKTDVIIDLNTASITELQSLHGIGSVLAERIVKFRETLGGFTDPDQLKDCYGISPEVFEKILPQLSVSGVPKIIYINIDDLSGVTHPYLSKKMSRLITAYKDHHGPLKDAIELRKVYPADTSWFERILPYVSFEIEDVGR